ncbi:EamA family transporter, partial [Burkholderia sp. SIMBA_045]
ILLSWAPAQAGVPAGALLIAGPYLCWAIDNNLTRKVAANDAMVIACVKGLVAGPVNIAIALATGAALPTVPITLAPMLT